MTSVHDRYAAHPSCIENMCLAKFAVTYEPKYDSSTNNENDEHIFEDENENDIEDNEQHRINDKVITLKNNLRQMCKRKQESILWVKSFKQKYRSWEILSFLSYPILTLEKWKWTPW